MLSNDVAKYTSADATWSAKTSNDFLELTQGIFFITYLSQTVDHSPKKL